MWQELLACVWLPLSIFDLGKKGHSCCYFQFLGRLLLWSVFYLRMLLSVIQMSIFSSDVTASVVKYF